MRQVVLGLPWVALGRDRLWGDSGFLCIYEPMVSMHQQFGAKGVLFLDAKYKEAFEARNNPAVSGVWPVYSTERRTGSRLVDQPLPDGLANLFTDGYRPVDFILTNKSYVLPHLVAQALGQKGPGIPVAYVCLNAGKDNVTRPISKAQGTLHELQVNNPDKYYLYAEAMSYMAASLVVWTTENQRKRGLEIARRFLAPVEVARLERRSMVNGCGIYDGLERHQIPDEEVRRWLQTPKTDFSVTFLGRVTSNKNVGYILDTMLPLFALHGIKLDMRAGKGLPDGEAIDAEDAERNLVSYEKLGKAVASRDDYAGVVLPSIQCLMYASVAEGYSIVPREVIYIGRPALLPTRPWALTAVGEDYPFLYSGQAEAVALVKRIEAGTITDDEVDRFLATRRNGYTCQFLREVAGRLYGRCYQLAVDRVAHYKALSHSKVLAAFRASVKVGELFTFEELFKRMKKNGLDVGQGSSKKAATTDEIAVYVRDMVEPVDPALGQFRRCN